MNQKELTREVLRIQAFCKLLLINHMDGNQQGCILNVKTMKRALDRIDFEAISGDGTKFFVAK